MSNVLDREKREQILALGRLGWPLRRIEEATGVRRETASQYLKAAGVGVREPGRWGHGPPKPAKDPTTGSSSPDVNPAIEVTTGSVVTSAWPPVPTRSPVASACLPFRDFIELAVIRGRTAMAIWQDLVDDHSFTAKYESVKRFVQKLRTEAGPEAHPRIETAAGEEGQVDYGEGPMVRHPETGKYRRTRLFVLTLGYSRKSVRLLIWKSSTKTWCELHEKAFQRLGGAPKVIVLDNLREGVAAPDIYEPALNPLYRDLLAHYGVVGVPARVGDPDRKGKVESGIGHTQKRMKGLRFESIEDAQSYLDRWDDKWADKRIHGTTKRQVAAMFEEERPRLLALPTDPFRYYQFGERTVHLDGFVEVEGAYYAPPPGLIGQRVPVQWDEKVVRILHPRTGELLREHFRGERGRHRIQQEDRPKTTPATTLQLLVRADMAGKHIGALTRKIHEHDGEIGVRRILGVLSLAKRHGSGAVDNACAAAIELGLPTYRFLRRYLDRHPPAPISLKQVDPLIRQLTLYRDLIDRKGACEE